MVDQEEFLALASLQTLGSREADVSIPFQKQTVLLVSLENSGCRQASKAQG